MNGPVAHRPNELLEFIRSQLAEHGVPPSYKEMAAYLGVRSVSTVQKLVDTLVIQGRVKRLRGHARGIEVVVIDHRRVPDCGCNECVRGRYLQELQFVHALKVDAPHIVTGGADNFRRISNETRDSLLGITARPAAPRMRAVLPREAG